MNMIAIKTVAMSVATATSLLLVLSPTSAHAQQSDNSTGRSVALEEITVTARKREESLTDVPVAISAFDASAIQNAGIEELRDLMDNTVGMVYNERDGNRSQAYVGVRGIKQITGGGGGRVSTFVDAIPVAGSQATIPFVDVANVEVYRGPQSAVFGRSVFAGALNYTLRQPTLDEANGGVDAQYGQYGRAALSGFYTVPLIEDKLGVYASFAKDEFDGPGGVISSDGFNMGSRDSTYYSLALRFAPTDNLSMTLRYTDTDLDDGPAPDYNLNPATDSNVVPSPTPGRAPLYFGELNFSDEPALSRNFCPNDANCILDPGWELKRERVTFDINYEMDNGHSFVVRALTSEDVVFDIDDQDNTNFAPAMGVFVVNMGTDTSIDEDYYEVVWTSPDENRLRGTLGYSQYEFDRENIAYFVHPSADLINGVGSTPSIGTQRVETSGFFGGVFYDLTDQLTVSFEARQQKDELSANDPDPTDSNDPRSSSDTFLPRLALTYALNDDVSFYAQYAEGVRSSTINPGAVAPLQRETAAALANITVDGQTFTSAVPFLDDVLAVDEEILKNYEIGMKGLFMDGRLRLNAAIFRMETDGYAETANLFYFPDGVASADVLSALTAYGAATNNALLNQPLSETALRVRGAVNIANLETQGVELDGTYVINEDWRIGANFTFIDASFDQGCAPIGADFGLPITQLVLASGGSLSCTTINGNAFPFVPEIQFGANVSYARLLNSGKEVFTRLDMRFEDEQYMDWFEAGIIPSSLRFNLRAGIDAEAWRLEAYVNNITDDRTPQGSQYEPARNEVAAFTGNGGPVNNTGLNIAIGYPREAGVKVSFRF